ncbi:MAG: GTP-binding protein, partial [Pseudomonadota bacterium]
AEQLKTLLATLREMAGPDLLRLKGLVALEEDPERPLVLHGVQHLIHPITRLPRWPSEDRRSRLVLIAEAAAAPALSERLHTLAPGFTAQP